MARIRLIATDLDGTLLRPDGRVSDRTRLALTDARARGVRIVLATARPVRTARMVAAEAAADDLLICSNGAIVYDLAREIVVAHHPIAQDTVRAVIVALRDAIPGTCFAFELGLRWVAEKAWTELRDDCECHGDDALHLCDEPATKLIVRHPTASVAELLEAVRALGRDDVTATHSGAPFVELSAAGVNKAKALGELCQGLGVPPEDVMAFGDMPNDIPMLGWAGRGIAVANAHADVLAAADEFTGSNAEDGVAAALERIFPRDALVVAREREFACLTRIEDAPRS
ncbi:MAG: HAD family phosphatase [Chloroflexota bacterium]|nr:MAG: HAD family phosphatase [Chloroflexota bacterium]